MSGSGEGGEANLAQGEKGPDTTQLTAEALQGIQSLFRAFHDESTPYLASPDPERMINTDYNDYAHLERVSEWSVTGDKGEAA
jgi:ATP-dependent helicase/nuclease subunit B